jgi:hypothetical protein
MLKKKLSQWSMLPAEVEVTHFYGTYRVIKTIGTLIVTTFEWNARDPNPH